MNEMNGAVQNRIEALKVRFMARCLDDADEFERLSTRLETGRRDDEARTSLRERVHRLAGSGTVFGFAALSQSALDLQEYLDEGCSDQEAGVRAYALVSQIRQLVADASPSHEGPGE